MSNQGANPYPVSVKAETLALLWECGSYRRTERIMAERYPDRSPSRTLIRRWAEQADPDRVASLAQETKAAFVTGIMEMSVQAMDRLHETLETLEPSQVPIPAGIAIDKGLKLMEIAQRAGIPTPDRPHQLVILINNPMTGQPLTTPVTIEALPDQEPETRE